MCIYFIREVNELKQVIGIIFIFVYFITITNIMLYDLNTLNVY